MPPLLLHVFDGFRVGGTEIRTCNIINYLKGRFRHIVVSNNGNFEAARHVDKGINIKYVNFAARHPFYPLILAKIARVLRTVSPDLIIAYEWGAIDWAIASILFCSVSVLMTVEGFEESELFVQKRKRLLVRKVLYPKCSKVVVCSSKLFDIARNQWRIPQNRLIHIPNGVDCKRFQPRPKTVAGNDDVKLGIVASLIKLKNHIGLLKSLNQLSENHNWKLFVAGDGPERENLEQYCKKQGLTNRVHFMGHVNDTPRFLKDLDVFCLASITEQMPVSILEAMAVGLPIVSTDVGDVKQMVSEGNKPFIVPVGDRSEYVKALQRLIEDKTLRLKIGDANRRKCIKEYDEELMFKRYEDLYTSLIS